MGHASMNFLLKASISDLAPMCGARANEAAEQEKRIASMLCIAASVHFEARYF